LTAWRSTAATCHLGERFYSAFLTKREDEYGCATIENRARFLNRIISEMKRQLGNDFAVTALIIR